MVAALKELNLLCDSDFVWGSFRSVNLSVQGHTPSHHGEPHSPSTCLCAVNMTPLHLSAAPNIMAVSWGVLGCRTRSPPRRWRGQLNWQRGLKSATMGLFSGSDSRLPLRVSPLLSGGGPGCRPRRLICGSVRVFSGVVGPSEARRTAAFVFVCVFGGLDWQQLWEGSREGTSALFRLKRVFLRQLLFSALSAL